MKLEEKYMWAIVNGVKEKVASILICKCHFHSYFLLRDSIIDKNSLHMFLCGYLKKKFEGFTFLSLWIH